MDLDDFKERARKASDNNKRFLEWAGKAKPNDLDKKAVQAHNEVFNEVDCLACANCCKTTSPIFYDRDIDRAAKAVRLKPSEFIEKYLTVDEDKDYVLKSSPCPFLDHENYCMIYSDRPTACREYPHTDRKRFYQVTRLTFNNTHICPAALKVVEKLKEDYRFQ